MGIITIAEADNSLSDVVYPEWDLLDDEFKEIYIEEGSSYIRLNWDNPSDIDSTFDWDDNATWPAGTILVVAKYADAARAGHIYSTGEVDKRSTAPISKTTEKVGSLEVTTEFAQSSSSGSKYSLRRLHDQMKVLGFTRKSSYDGLSRV